MIPFIYIPLLVLSSAPSVIGIYSYISIALLIIMNLIQTKIDKTKIIYFVAFLTVVLISFFKFILEFPLASLDLSIINLLLQLFFFLTFPKTSEASLIIKKSILFQAIACLSLSIYGLIVNDHSMFVLGGNTKGINGLLIPKGIYSTPQVLASVSLALCFLYKEKIVRFLGLIILVSSFNRTSLTSYILILFTKIKNKVFFLFLMLLVCIIVLYKYDLSLYLNFRTITSRLYLFFGGLSTINLNSIPTNIFGSWEEITFYLPTYGIHKNYIENGYLYIFKYTGLIGLLIYISFGIKISISIFKKDNITLFVYFIIYYYLFPLLTHEYLTNSFYQILLLFYIYNYDDKH